MQCRSKSCFENRKILLVFKKDKATRPLLSYLLNVHIVLFTLLCFNLVKSPNEVSTNTILFYFYTRSDNNLLSIVIFQLKGFASGYLKFWS